MVTDHLALLAGVFLASYAAQGPQQAVDTPKPASDSKPAPALADKPNFAGKWTLNAEKTESFRDKMREARASSAGRDAGGGGMGGRGGGMGRGGGGMGGRRGGMGGRGGAGGNGADSGADGRGQMDDLTAEMRNPSKALTILQGNPEFVVMGDDSVARRYSLDGQKAKVAGGAIEDKAKWDGNRIVIESHAGDGPKLTSTYSLLPEKKQLQIVSRLEMRSGQTVAVRRVYDSAEKPSE